MENRQVSQYFKDAPLSHGRFQLNESSQLSESPQFQQVNSSHALYSQTECLFRRNE